MPEPVFTRLPPPLIATNEFRVVLLVWAMVSVALPRVRLSKADPLLSPVIVWLLPFRSSRDPAPLKATRLLGDMAFADRVRIVPVATVVVPE